MATTYRTAVNELLKGSNEVTLTAATFAGAVGVQDYAKDIINRAYLEICAEEEQWPYLAAADSNTNEPYSGNVTLETVAGQRWYLIKVGSTSVVTDFSKIDWDTFTLTTEGATGRTAPFIYEDLTFITFNQWMANYSRQENDDAADAQEFGQPLRVIQSKDHRFFGLSPIPEGVYGVYFSAWVNPTRLSAEDDAILIPDMYVPVLLHRARYYFYMFKKDFQEATIAERAYKRGLQTMRRNLIGNQVDYMRDDWVIRRRF